MSPIAHSSLSIEPSALAVRAVGPWLRTALDGAGSDGVDALMMRAELAVHEACMNVVDHANLPAGSSIDLFLELTPQHLVIRVCDPGDQFDLESVPEPAPATLQERGYGVKIIRALVSELTYRRLGAVNELQLRIDISDES
jgi:anti-sigma regulatory factor (Ser/Thr protein kinase)